MGTTDKKAYADRSLYVVDSSRFYIKRHRTFGFGTCP
jgi:hypothetical protein